MAGQHASGAGDRVALVIAESAIRQLHARYADACWRRDAEALRDCFTADAVWDFSSGAQQGPDAIVAFLATGFTHYRRILVTCGTPIVTLKSEGASARTWLVEDGVRADGARYRLIGHYSERFANQGGGWRIAWRRFQPHFSGLPGMTGDFIDVPDPGPPG